MQEMKSEPTSRIRNFPAFENCFTSGCKELGKGSIGGGISLIHNGFSIKFSVPLILNGEAGGRVCSFCRILGLFEISHTSRRAPFCIADPIKGAKKGKKKHRHSWAAIFHHSSHVTLFEKSRVHVGDLKKGWIRAHTPFWGQ